MKYWAFWKLQQKEMLLFLRQMWKANKSTFFFIHLSLFSHIQKRCSRFIHSRVAQSKIQPILAILWVHTNTVWPAAGPQSSQRCLTFSLILPSITVSRSRSRAALPEVCLGLLNFYRAPRIISAQVIWKLGLQADFMIQKPPEMCRLLLRNYTAKV